MRKIRVRVTNGTERIKIEWSITLVVTEIGVGFAAIPKESTDEDAMAACQTFPFIAEVK